MSERPREAPRTQPPERAAPSAWAYRGSIAALVAGSFLALFLVLRPPASDSQAEPVRSAAPVATETSTATPEAAATPRPTPAPAATVPPATATPTPAEPTPTPEPTLPPTPTAYEYEIVAGDTLSDIAYSFDTSVEAILALNPGLDPAALQIGQIILVP